MPRQLETVEAALDDVAAAVDGPVEAAGPFAAPASARELVDALGNGRLDAAPAQVGAGRVALVSHHPFRPDTGPSRPGARDPDLVDDRLGLGAVVAGAGGEREGQRSAPPVAGQVALARQPAAGASEPAFLEPPSAAVCWWARTIVESSATS